MACTLARNELSALKSKLTRAKNSGDPQRVIDAVRDAYAVFDEKGWPDCWGDWQLAEFDADWAMRYA